VSAKTFKFGFKSNDSEEHVRGVSFLPSAGSVYTMWYKGHWMRVIRYLKRPPNELHRYHIQLWFVVSFISATFLQVHRVPTAYSPIRIKFSRTSSSIQKKLGRMLNGSSFMCTLPKEARGSSSRLAPSGPLVRLSWILG